MRISDWSSDVCSSDLRNRFIHDFVHAYNRTRLKCLDYIAPIQALNNPPGQDRKSVVKGQSVSVRVDLGGRRIIKKTKNNDTSTPLTHSSTVNQQPIKRTQFTPRTNGSRDAL